MNKASFTYKFPGQQEYEGVTFGRVYDPQVLDQLKTFKLNDEDILLVSLPKSGRIWLEEVVWLLENNVDFEEAGKLNVRARIPPVEIKLPGMQSNLEKLILTPSPRLMSTFMYHKFYAKSLATSKCKVIVMLRNPKDLLVSYYHFYRMCVVTGNFEGSWDQFFELFKNKALNLGDWFDHTMGWWNNCKDMESVLFVKFEDMKKDAEGTIKQIAEFLGRKISTDLVHKIAEHTTIESLRENPTTNMKDIAGYKQEISPFMRKGAVGDWKNYFTDDQNEYFDKLYHEKTTETGLELEFE